MDTKKISSNIINDILNKKFKVTTAIDIVVLIMEMVEHKKYNGYEKLDYAMSIVQFIIDDGKEVIPKEILDVLIFLHDNQMIPIIINSLCKAFKQQIKLIKKYCNCCVKKPSVLHE